MLNGQRSIYNFQLTCRLLCRAKSGHLCSNLERFLDSARNARVIERWRLNSYMAGIVVKPRARILYGHDWVFSSEVLKVFGNPADGEVISLKDGKDRLIGSAIYNSKSQIVARRFSRRRQDLDFDFFRRRITHASEYRDRRNVDAKLRQIGRASCREKVKICVGGGCI